MSWQMSVVAGFMRMTRKRKYSDRKGGLAMLRRPKSSAEPPRSVRRRVRITKSVVRGFEVYAVTPGETSRGAAGQVVVYVHGGSYVGEIVKQHWALVADIVTGLGVEVRIPIYGLAPEHHALEALQLTVEVLEGLHREERPCYLMGDSAGGGLALIAAQQSAGRIGDALRGVTLLSPWLDLTMANPEIVGVETRDPWLSRAALHTVAEAWAGEVPLDDERVSPLFGDISKLPPVDLWVGGRDITCPDTRLLRDRLAQHGGVTYHEDESALHVFPLLPVPEGRAAREEIIQHIAAVLL